MFVLNTVLGEELLFRGLLLPRMSGAFGRGDWIANGVLFAVYPLHVLGVIPQTLLVDTLVLGYASRRYRSALVGIAVHSAQSVFFSTRARCCWRPGWRLCADPLAAAGSDPAARQAGPGRRGRDSWGVRGADGRRRS